ncbi:PH domain-containing protein, partial [Candidatus Parcubacteria bacterium]|nr:PH domain-containing protein [Candidatus Parcubacteria bacterium]
DVVLLIRRHPFIALMPLAVLVLAALAPIVVYIIFHAPITNSSYLSIYSFTATLYYLFIWILAFYHLMIYTLNTIIVTNKRVIDRDQNRFFDWKISELHIYRVQDITVSTKGFIPTLLHYGNVVVQTAGSEKEFIFKEMPHPEMLKDAIMKVVSMSNAGLKAQAD